MPHQTKSKDPDCEICGDPMIGKDYLDSQDDSLRVVFLCKRCDLQPDPVRLVPPTDQ